MTDIMVDTDNLDPPHWAILQWLETELAYADAKFGADRSDHDALMVTEGLRGRFNDDIEMYLHRAKVLGIENPGGRQALGKCMAVIVATLESSLRVWGGKMPVAGRSSGDMGDT